MTTEQIQIVRKTWRKLMAIDQAIIGDLFYSKLFADHPELRRLFPKDMGQQYLKLTDMLTAITAGLNNFSSYSDELRAMGKRHVNYGVKYHHYNMVGDALLWTLQKGLGNEWNDNTAQAWAACYNTLVEVMTEGVNV